MRELGMSNVEPIRKGMVSHERKPDTNCIELLQEMLDMAKAGELVGFSGAFLYYDGIAARRRAGHSNYALIGAVHTAAHIMTRERLEQ